MFYLEINFGFLHETDDYQQRSIEGSSKSPGINNFQNFSTYRKQWKCSDNNCEEISIKCKNNVCNTEKLEFKSANYHPEIPQVEPFLIDFPNIAEILKFPQLPSPEIDTSIYDNSGLIDFITNLQNVTYYYWSNSKHINKACHNNTCTIKTKTCTNGKCEEKTTQQ